MGVWTRSTFLSILFITDTSRTTPLPHLFPYPHSSSGNYGDIWMWRIDSLLGETALSAIKTNKNYHRHTFVFQIWCPANYTPSDHPEKATNNPALSYSPGVGHGRASLTQAGSCPQDWGQEWLSLLRSPGSILSPDMWLPPQWILDVKEAVPAPATQEAC